MRHRIQCYCCKQMLGVNPFLVRAEDSKAAFVDAGCYEQARAAGSGFYQGPNGKRIWTYPKDSKHAEWTARQKEAEARQGAPS